MAFTITTPTTQSNLLQKVLPVGFAVLLHVVAGYGLVHSMQFTKKLIQEKPIHIKLIKQELPPLTKPVVKKTTLKQPPRKELVKKQVISHPKPILEPAAKPAPLKAAENIVIASIQPAQPIVKHVAQPKITTTYSELPAIKVQLTQQKSLQTSASNAQSDVQHGIRKNVDYKHYTPPKYPKRSERLGEEGTVLLHILIGKNGYVKDFRMRQTSGHRLLDKAAVQAIKNWQFEPAITNGITVVSWAEVPVEFYLR